jgi:soluble lytic murein transglycosylase-like protein
MYPLKATAGLILMIAAIPSSSSAQNPSADWTELRRRLTQNLEMESFLEKYSDKNALSVKPIWRRNRGTGRKTQQAADPSRVGMDPQEIVRRAACSEGVPPDVALAVIEHESNFNNSVHGKAGEIGASQILPETGELFKFDRKKLGADYEYNIHSGMKVMKFLLDQFPIEDAIRAYNGGPAFQDSSAGARKKIENYFSSIERLRRKYERVRCI